MTKTDRERLEDIKQALENDWYKDTDPMSDFKFLWQKFQELLNK